MTEIKNAKAKFQSAVSDLSERIYGILDLLPNDVKNSAEEIRIRSERPLSLTLFGKPFYVNENSSVGNIPTEDTVIVSKEEVYECYKNLISNSLYSHIDEIENGYIMMKNGHRAGICGTRTNTGGMADISSVNIRIAKEIIGVSDAVEKNFYGFGILICGEPSSGKTTLLRDLIRKLSSGFLNRTYKVAAVDTRGELSAASGGINYNDLGPNTDVLIGYEKDKGIEMALRTLSPQIIAFDEIGTLFELQKIKDGFNAGVSFITTAHIGKKEDIMKRQLTRELLKTGIIKTVVLLSNRNDKRITVYKAEEICGY